MNQQVKKNNTPKSNFDTTPTKQQVLQKPDIANTKPQAENTKPNPPPTVSKNSSEGNNPFVNSSVWSRVRLAARDGSRQPVVIGWYQWWC